MPIIRSTPFSSSGAQSRAESGIVVDVGPSGTSASGTYTGQWGDIPINVRLSTGSSNPGTPVDPTAGQTDPATVDSSPNTGSGSPLETAARFAKDNAGVLGLGGVVLAFMFLSK